MEHAAIPTNGKARKPLPLHTPPVCVTIASDSASFSSFHFQFSALLPTMNLSSLPTLLIYALLLLSSCKDSASPTDKGGDGATASSKAVPRTPGARADSLGGIPGHQLFLAPALGVLVR